MATIATEERLGRLEADYERLATKADLANLKTDLTRWMLSAMIALVVAVAALFTAAIAALKFVGG